MFTIVITSTVYVTSNNTVLVDSNQRIQQYLESFLFYINCMAIQNIIICDNSGFDYSSCEEFKNKTFLKSIEFLSFLGNSEEITNRGKGYGEGEIMNYVLANSKLIQNNDSFCKITGRIKILNIDSILLRLNNSNNYFQRIGLNPFVVQKKVDTRFYHCTIKTFKEKLLKAYYNVNDDEGKYLEHVYYNELFDSNSKYYNFDKLPNFKGVSGSTGQSYDINPFRLFFLKNIYVVFKFFKVIN